MRILKWTLIGVLVFTLVFLFLPVGIDEDDLIENFMATRTYSTSFNMTHGSLVAPFLVPAELNPGNSDIADTVLKSFESAGGITDYFYEFASASDIYGAGHDPCNPKQPNSPFGVWRSGYGGYHGGVDMSPEKTISGEAIWTLALFSGTVRESRYDYSWGRTVVVESDAVPGLYFRYAHMGYGNASSYGGSMSSWMSSLKYPNGEQPTSKDQSPSDYEKSNGYNGYNVASTWAGGGVLVKVGDHVEVGQRIGLFGTTGSSTGPHSHLELYLAVDAAGQLKGYEAYGGIMYPNYRTDGYTVIANKGFSQSSWGYYVSKDSYMPNQMTPQEVQKLLDQNFGADSGTSYGGDGSDDE